MDFLFTPEAISSLLTLTFLEVILGIDNIVFISIVVGKLPVEKRKGATNIGLLLALVLRILLLFAISWLVAMQSTLFEISTSSVHAAINGQSLILFLGGLFLLYKSTKEIHEKIDHAGEKSENVENRAGNTLGKILLQILLIDAVFSVDSILTAVGMTSGINGALWIMIIAVVISILAMMLFAHPVTRFVHKHPSLQILALSFLILIGFMLIAEGAHLSHLELLGTSVGAIPKGYLYFAIAFSLLVEFLNMRFRKKSIPLKL
jgi:predicted tellurium resistance membrane protein TerC